MREKHIQHVVLSRRDARGHDENDLNDLCEEVGVLEVVRGT